jgi:cytochrome oxidase Cu insertion factor (SCO1/SenC/PrrC family)
MKPLMNSSRVFCLAWAALAAWLSAGGAAGRAATDSHGLEVGAKAPGFKLRDQAGQEHSLSEFVQKGKVVALVFYRSADW